MNLKITGITNSSNKIIGIGIALGIAFWFFESSVHVFVFREGSLTGQLLSPKAHEIWMRLLVAGIIVIFSVFTQFLLNQRKRAEVTVRKREEFLDSIFDAIQDGISVLDRDLKVVRANSWMNEMYSDEAPIIGKKCYEVYQKRKTSCPWCPSVKTIETGETQSALVPYPSEEECKGWIALSSFPLKDEKGEVTFIIEHVKDITEIKQAQESLREQRDKAQKYLDIAGVIIIVIDSKGDVSLINKKGCEVLGYKEEEIIGKNWFDNFLPKRMKDEVNFVFKKLIAGEIEPVEYFENSVLTKGGQEPIIAWHNTVLRDKKSDIIGTLSSGEDITDRKKAEEELQQSQQELHIRNEIAQLFLTSPEDVVYEKVLMKILEAMESRYGVFGYIDEAGNLVCPSITRGIWNQCQMPDKDIIFPRETWGGIWGQALLKKETFYSNVALRVPEGHIPIQRALAVPIIHQSEVIGVLTVANKVTNYDEINIQLLETIADYIAPILNARLQRDFQERERKKVEEARRESEHRYRDLYENAPNAYFSLSPLDGSILRCNKAALRLLGYDRETMIGVKAFDLYVDTPHGIPKAKEVFSHFKKGESVQDVELQMKHKNGHPIWVSLSVEPIKDPDGNAIESRSVVIDITGRKCSEEALRKSEERFRELAELLPEAIYEMDLRGNLTFVNRNAFSLFKYSQNDFDHGLNGFHMIDPEDRHRAIENAQKILKGEKSGLEEYTALRKDGSTFPAMFRSSAIYRGGKPIGFRGFIIDITEKKKLQDQLQKAQKMEAIGTLAGGIAHDFNNILYSIIGNTEMTMDDVPEDSLARRNLEEVMTAGKRAKEMVRQILDFSRQSVQEKRPLRIQPVIDEALQLLKASLPATIEVHEDIDRKCGSIMADPTQIHQIVMNLCTNAYHAMREKGGVMGVTLSQINIDSSDLTFLLGLKSGSYLKLTVSDTGHGMDHEVMERIFDPYFTTKRPGEGTGMGLSAVHGIVNSYGGNIKVFSSLGEGTKFEVYLPLMESTADAPLESLSMESIPGGNESILLVDDEENIVRMVQQMLERLGYQVTARTSSIEALEAFSTLPKKFDIIITDQTMPNMTGEKLAKESIQIRPDIPVILCTGFSEIISEEKAKAMGIREYVMKPVLKSEMATAIRRVLDGEKRQ